MTKRFFGFLAVAALVVSVAAPLSAQSIRLMAKIPFEFTVDNQTLPAGEYSVMSGSNPLILQIRNDDTSAGVLALAGSAGGGVSSPARSAKLVFNRYGDHYFLSQIWDGYSGTGHELPMARSERELAKTASTTRVEILAMLMPR